MNLAPNKYADKVKSGKIVAPVYIKQAIARHESDLKRTDIYFDKEAGARVLSFFSILIHTKGKWGKAKERFNPLPWQQWLLYVLFGWKNLDGSRRFTTAYIEVPRKNGKSTLMSGVALYMFLADDEVGPEIYTGATTTKQAKIVFDEAKEMVKNNPALKKYVNVYQHHLQLKNDGVSKFEPVSRQADNLDGLNPTCAIIDEYHAHKTSEIYDVFKSALGSRVSPLQLTITTAGFNKGAPCYQLRKTCINVLAGKKKDDSMFTMVFAPDKDDDWTLQRTWKKVNPSLGATKLMRYMKNEFTTAKNDVGYQPNFKTKHLNIWNDGSTTWIETSKWDAAAKTLNDSHLKKWECVGGLDLASTRDITCYGLLFTNGPSLFWKPYFFIPEDTVSIRSKADGVAYDAWVRGGHLITTPGNVTDYNFIKAHIMQLGEKFRLKSSAFDRWNSSQLINDLIEDGAQFFPFAQSTAHMNFPTKEVDRKLSNKELTHDGNPVMSWMISNVEMITDSSGNIKPDKKKSEEKIDGVVSLVMAMGEWLTPREEEQKESVYSTRGFIEL